MNNVMKIRKGSSRVSGDTTTIEIDRNGLEIIADDNNTLYRIMLVDGELQIRTGGPCSHGGKELDDTLLIEPRTNGFNVSRKAYSNAI